MEAFEDKLGKIGTKPDSEPNFLLTLGLLGPGLVDLNKIKNIKEPYSILKPEASSNSPS